MSDDLDDAQFAWAHEYDGYQRLARSPEELGRLLSGARETWSRQGRVPDWCGVDLLRGWAFYLARTHRFGGELGAEWIAVLNALSHRPDASPEDHPPGRATDHHAHEDD